MIEEVGDLWELPADARCITTNGFVKSNGDAVMGAGCAKEAARKYPWLPAALGGNIKLFGNKLFDFQDDLISFPVKHHWYEAADLDLIRQSAVELAVYLDHNPKLQRVLLPRPGCGNGRLRWEDVKPVIAAILDDRVVVITKAVAA